MIFAAVMLSSSATVAVIGSVSFVEVAGSAEPFR
jgi:hypothetical protein